MAQLPPKLVPVRLRPLLDQAMELAELFEARNHRLYLVGGAVRDLFVDVDASPDGMDLDFTTDALPDETEDILRPWADSVWDQGKRFGTVGAIHSGRRMEITTHRAEVYPSDTRKPDVRYSTDVEEDLARRDFTVNAMALSLPTPTLVDPFGGMADLAAKRLRTPLGPEVSFSEDPLRMMRAARFLSRYDLTPDPSILQAIATMRERLAIVSAERIRDELDKLLVAPSPEAGLWFLVNTGLASQFLPELPALELEQDPIHRHKDVLAHTIAVVGKTRPERLVRLAALFHDVGKPKTRAFGPGGVTFHHHDVVGARMTRERMRALRYPEQDIEAVSRLVELHLRFHTYRLGWTDRAVRRYVRDAAGDVERLNELTRCDSTTRNQAKAAALSRRLDELEARILELSERESLDAMRPELDGNQVMGILGIAPGPTVGAALGFLMELRLDEGLLGEEEAIRRLQLWHEERKGS